MSEAETKKAEQYYKEHPELRRFVERYTPTGKPSEGKLSFEDRQRIQAYEELREPVPEGREIQPLSPNPTAEQLESFQRGAEELKLSVQHHYYPREPAVVSNIRENDSKTVCVTRPMFITVDNPEKPMGKRTVRDYDIMAPEVCRIVPATEMRCIREAEAQPTCGRVERTFACANDMSAIQAAEFASANRDETQKCINDLKGERKLEEVRMTERTVRGRKITEGAVLGEAVYTMPRDVATATKAGLRVTS